MSRSDTNFSQCDVEPIHVPGAIQPHGALLALRPDDLMIVQASENAPAFLERHGMRPGAARFGDEAADRALAADLRAWRNLGQPTLLRPYRLGDRQLNAVAHRADDLIILEFEPGPGEQDQTLEALYPRLRDFTERLHGLKSLSDLCAAAARDVRRLTAFDRVLIYSFDEEGVGTVLAESRNERLPSCLHQRFPASDIPKQARELYRVNRLRIIPDANYRPASLTAAADDGSRPLDMTHCILRSVSPVHLEYMRNMGTLASMSISIVVDGRLWGLISCHNAEPLLAPLQVRASCDFLAQVLALQVGSLERTAEAAHRIELKSIQSELLTAMAQEPSYPDALARNPDLWLRLAGADGAALVDGQTVQLAGATPSETQVRRIAAWLGERAGDDLFATDCLAAEMPEAADDGPAVSGLLALTISQVHSRYLLWFRREQVRSIPWAGDPAKIVDQRDGKIHPRNSFSLWIEQVRGRSAPWSKVEMEAAGELRDAILRVVLRQAEEMAALSEELGRSNRELEAFSYSVSHDLRAPFRHIVGYAQLLGEHQTDFDERGRHYLKSIQDAAASAGRLVDDLLAFSQLGRASIAKLGVDMHKLVDEVRRTLEPDTRRRDITWKIGALPPAWGDPSMLRQVLVNLVDNAVKYTRGRSPAEIEVSASEIDGETVYTVQDNGVGFDMAYAGKLFGVFQRLHRVEEFEGTGIGLAIARRVIERHHGRIWAEGEVGRGAAVHFILPSAPA